MSFPFLVKGYWQSRALFQSGLGLIYLIAFAVTANQFGPLLGARGLLPAAEFVKQVPFRESPSLFFVAPQDGAFLAAAWLGIALSCLAVTGISERFATWVSMLVWVALWVLYLSFVNVGQTFYGFGWESILLETGFIAIFLGCRSQTPSFLSILMLRWIAFRVMFGAGLIKMRGDSCWRDYTCLDYHYETQPMPNPLSWYLHWAPQWTHRFGVGFNHFAELAVPFGYFLPQPICSIAGFITIVFQASIMASGNLSWLNLMTIVLALPMIDTRHLSFMLPMKLPELHGPGPVYRIVIAAVAVLVVVLSINLIRNMISPNQVMNTTYNPLHLVGTYGAFGAITRTRSEVIIEGTSDAVLSPLTKWSEFGFKGKPGEVGRMPPQIAPYHLRLDWLMWFAAMSDYSQNPWFFHLMAKLLQNDRDTLSLLGSNPFADRAPRFVRALTYEYHFTDPEERKKTGDWWKRTLTGSYFPPVSLADPGFHEVLRREGWL